jgi:uncharacterized protein YecA (UPF0149 family)
MTTKGKADDNGPFKEFVFEEWLREGFEGIRSQVKFKRVKFDTSEFESHMRNAAKEQLLAVRSLVESFIDIFEEQESDQEAPKTQKA